MASAKEIGESWNAIFGEQDDARLKELGKVIAGAAIEALTIYNDAYGIVAESDNDLAITAVSEIANVTDKIAEVGGAILIAQGAGREYLTSIGLGE